MSLKDEIDNIFKKDPAARSKFEVLLCYPGLHAILVHRFSHKLWNTGSPTLRLLARLLSGISRSINGIEIHPGAQLGERVFIDHGLGVVIGETAIVGDDSVIYQGVTLGAQAAARMGAQTRGKKRHPTLGRGVVVGSGAQVLGDVFVGDEAQIASGSIVVKDVPPQSVVVGVPGRVIFKNGQRVKDEMPDLEAEAIKALRDRLAMLERRVEEAAKAGTGAGASIISADFTFDAIFDATPPSDGGGGLGNFPSAISVSNGSSDALPLSADGRQQPIRARSSTPTTSDPVELFLHGAGI